MMVTPVILPAVITAGQVENPPEMLPCPHGPGKGLNICVLVSDRSYFKSAIPSTS